ncbi:MAG: TIGR01212 family radical SAM protein, partial [Peptostreptococcaceae bacterium]
KISLDGGFSCPNRDGTISRGGCIFCSERGSGDFAGNRQMTISQQFNDIKTMMNKKWKNGKYIAYFQAYTNTYAPIEILRKKYDEGLEQEDVVGLAIATRPDCLNEEVLDLLQEYSKKVYTWVELGLQTSNDETASLINRGYKLKVFDEAVQELYKRNIDVVAHVILGLPGESKEDMISTIKYISKLPIKGVKMHLLHVLKNTRLEELLEEGSLKLLEMDEYIDLITEAITILPQGMIVHRLTGDAPRELLVGPMWSLKKWEVLNAIDNKLETEDLFQGKLYEED